LRKGRFAIVLLAVFLVADLVAHGRLATPAGGTPRAPVNWVRLAEGAYEAVTGRFGHAVYLLPLAPGGRVLMAQGGGSGGAVPAQPRASFTVPGVGRIEVWGATEVDVATLTRGGDIERLPLSPDGREVLVVGRQGKTLSRLSVSPGARRLVPLVPAVVDGVRESDLYARPPGSLAWAPVWAMAPFFGASAKSVYYFSNRLEKRGSATLELWNLTGGSKDVLLERAGGLAAFGVDARGRAVVADSAGEVIAAGTQGVTVLGRRLRPLSMAPGGLRLAVLQNASGRVAFLDLITDRLTELDMGGDRVVGGGAFAGDGRYFAVLCRNIEGALVIRVWRVGPKATHWLADLTPPAGMTFVAATRPSWLTGDMLVAVSADRLGALETWGTSIGGPDRL